MKRQIGIDKIKFSAITLTLFLTSLILQLNMLVPVFLLSLFIYAKLRHQSLRDFRIIDLVLLFVIILTSSYFIIKNGWGVFYIPFCVIPMLVTLLFNQLELSLLSALVVSQIVAAISGNQLFLGMLIFISGLLASILVSNARKRSTVIRAGLSIGLIQAALLFFLNRYGIAPEKSYLISYLIVIFNGFASSIIVLGVLPVFEYLFKTVTKISLLELADFQQPLLQRLILEAPGTYHHSLIVGNLSEAACTAVGANELLARIGAYYHDIGKLQKPGYFSENQNIVESKHDSLPPSMSKLVIINHVKDGVELARKYKLNPQIINFIQEHHGSSLVYYFYRRALENLEEDQEIKEEGFRYAGPRPTTKETATVLLADSVEAATRALKEPTPIKIEEVVHKIINNKFIDGQLDNCELTLKDLEKISAVFIRILNGIYHSRITYPETSKNESR